MTASRLERIMDNLADALRAIPAVRGVTVEAPREDEGAAPFRSTNLPHIWVWEEAETPDASYSTGSLRCSLPVAVECVFPYIDADPVKGLRVVGRQLKAQIQQAVSADIGRGFDQQTAAALAFDTLERGNVIGPLPQRGYGVVHLDYEITYTRGFNNPYDARPSV